MFAQHLGGDHLCLEFAQRRSAMFARENEFKKKQKERKEKQQDSI